jgi:hypothetical protein
MLLMNVQQLDMVFYRKAVNSKNGVEIRRDKDDKI